MEREKDLSRSIIESVSGLKSELVQVIPNILNGLLILSVGITIAYLLKWSSSLFVKWMMRLLPSSILKKDFVENNFEPLALGTGRLLFLLTTFISLVLSLKSMGLQIVSEWMQNLGRYFPNIFGSLIILFIGWKAKEIIENLSYKAFNRSELLYSSVISKVLSWSIFIVSVLVSLEQLGIGMGLVVSIATVLIGVGAFGIALTFSLGAKATISDILYCYQLHKYFKIGQEIELKEIKGTIQSIGPVFILIETKNGTATVPGNMFNNEITKVSANGDKTSV